MSDRKQNKFLNFQQKEELKKDILLKITTPILAEKYQISESTVKRIKLEMKMGPPNTIELNPKEKKFKKSNMRKLKTKF